MRYPGAVAAESRGLRGGGAAMATAPCLPGRLIDHLYSSLRHRLPVRAESYLFPASATLGRVRVLPYLGRWSRVGRWAGRQATKKRWWGPEWDGTVQ